MLKCLRASGIDQLALALVGTTGRFRRAELGRPPAIASGYLGLALESTAARFRRPQGAGWGQEVPQPASSFLLRTILGGRGIVVLSRWPIRNKLLFGLLLLAVIVGTLVYNGLYVVYAYRNMLRGLSDRVAELPKAAVLGQRVSDLRVALRDLRSADFGMVVSQLARLEFNFSLEKVEQALQDYREELENNSVSDGKHPLIGNGQLEWETVHKIEATLAAIRRANEETRWWFGGELLEFEHLSGQLDQLHQLTLELPSHLHHNIVNLRQQAKSQYRSLIAAVILTAAGAGVLLLIFAFLAHRWVFRPLRLLVKGSRYIAVGHFDHRIRIATNDEFAELADALNDMTARFRAIKEDLDRQVRQRTKQVVLSEKLASVGFLAAGVAHEINNPLAAVVVGAEALESRVAEDLADHPDGEVIQKYLRMIQTEAFRCKGITEKLLDFSRIGDRDRDFVDLRSLVEEMIELLRHHGRYKNKHIDLVPGGSPLAWANAPEIKQVVLNLLTNALDSLDDGGTVWAEVRYRTQASDGDLERNVSGGRNASQDQPTEHAELIVTDDGCGMTPEVIEHLFEPFFTRRRSGQGTGLGLSITYRIIQDHNGQIEASSEGPGCGSRFQVTLPVRPPPGGPEDPSSFNLFGKNRSVAPGSDQALESQEPEIQQAETQTPEIQLPAAQDPEIEEAETQEAFTQETLTQETPTQETLSQETLTQEPLTQALGAQKVEAQDSGNQSPQTEAAGGRLPAHADTF